MLTEPYVYSVGGVRFGLILPTSPKEGNLAQFRTDGNETDLLCTVTAADKITVPAGTVMHKDFFLTYLMTETGTVRVFEDERGGEPFMIDHSVNGASEVTVRTDRLPALGSTLLLKILDIPRRILSFDGLILHASYINVNGEAILFTAPKQTGKSTQASLWEKYRGASVVNGDRALIRRREGKWYAFGSPYCGTSKICRNESLPIKAIVILSQAKESTARRAAVRKAFAAMLDGTAFDTWDTQSVADATRICGDIVSEVPFYELSCLPDESAITALENVL